MNNEQYAIHVLRFREGCKDTSHCVLSIPQGECIANDQSVDSERAEEIRKKVFCSGTEGVPSEAGSVRAGVYDDAEKAQLGTEEGGARAVDERRGSVRVYSRGGAQPPRALDGADSGRTGEGYSGFSVSHRSGSIGYGGCGGAEGGTV